jgi:hypothetical protein
MKGSFLSYIKNENRRLYNEIIDENNYQFFDQVNILGVVLHSRGFSNREKDEGREIKYGDFYR